MRASASKHNSCHAFMQSSIRLDVTIALRYSNFVGKMISSADGAAQLGVTPARIRALCQQRRISGARLIGRIWMLPADFNVTPATRGPKLKKAKRDAKYP